MQMLKKIFNSEKKYYLELNDNEVPQPVKQAVKAAEKVADTVQEKAEKVADTVQEKVAEVIESEPVKQAVEQAKEVTKSAENKVASEKNQKQASSKKSKSSPAPAATPRSPQASGASPDEPPFWVAAMYKSNTSKLNSDGTPAEPTFATDNLMPTVTKYRRSPGPSLNKFKEMARKTKGFRG